VTNLQISIDSKQQSQPLLRSEVYRDPRPSAVRNGNAVKPALQGLDFSAKGEGNGTDWMDSLSLAEQYLPYTKRKLRPADTVYTAGERLSSLYIVRAGTIKLENLASDGRARNADILFDREWLGLDGISSGYHTCSATSIDFGEVWVIDYTALSHEMSRNEALLRHMLKAFSRSLERSRDQLLSVTSRSAVGRVGDFLVRLAQDLREHGRRVDVITAPISRAEMGAHLGMRVESISRSLAKLEKLGLISFSDKGHRSIEIRDLDGIRQYVEVAKDSEFGVA